MTTQDFEKMESRGLIKDGTCIMLYGADISIEGRYKGVGLDGVKLMSYTGGHICIVDISHIDTVFKAKRTVKPGQKTRSYEMINV